MVAYSIYKNEKVAWIEAHKAKHGSYPTQEELDKYFYPSIGDPDTTQRYNDQTVTLVNNFIHATTYEDLTEYKKKLRDEEIIKNVHKPFSKSVLESLTAALLASILTAGFSTAYWLYSEMQESRRLEELVRNAPISEDVKKQILNTRN